MFDPHRGCYIQNTAAWRDSEIADDQLRKRRHQRSHVISYCAHCSLQTKAKRLEKSGEIKQLSLSSIIFLFGKIGPEKQDYLFRCSVSPARKLSAATTRSCSIYSPTGLFPESFAIGK